MKGKYKDNFMYNTFYLKPFPSPEVHEYSFSSETVRQWNNSGVPVVVAGHLLHDLTVDLVPECLVFGGGTEDLVGELQGTLHLLGGVISHIFQDRYARVKEE